MNPAEAVTILAIVVSLAWWASLWLWPWKRCPRCRGRRKLTGPDGDVFRRCGPVRGYRRGAPSRRGEGGVMGPDEGSSRWAAEQAARALEAIRWNWGDAYKIWVADGGRWMAQRLDDLGGPIESAGPEELRKAILEDYMVKPVPRDLPGETLG